MTLERVRASAMLSVRRSLGVVVVLGAVACATPPAPPPTQPAPVLTNVPEPPPARVAPPPTLQTEIVPDLATLVFSADERFSAVLVATHRPEGAAVALVEDQGDRRVLRRLLPVRSDPVLAFLGSVLMIRESDKVTLADAERQLTLPAVSNATASTTWEGHLASVSPDGELVVVDTQRLSVSARMKLGLEDASQLAHGAGDRFLVWTQNGVLAIVDLAKERELLRLSDVADFLWRGDDLVTVQQPFPWKLVFHDLKTGKATWTRVEANVWGGFSPEVAFVPGKDELVITAPRDPDTPTGRRAPNLALVQTRSGKARKLRIPVKDTPEAFGPSVMEGGILCVRRRYSAKDEELESRPVFDLQRGAPWASTANDALCVGSHLLLLPAKLRGNGRAVVPSVRVFGMFGGLVDDELGPAGVLARVETDNPAKGGDAFVGAHPALALIDTIARKKILELPLPELDGVPHLQMQFSNDGKRLAVCWNQSLFVLDLTQPPSRPVPLAQCPGAFELTGRGRYLTSPGQLAPLDVATGKPVTAPWWQ